MRLATDTGGTFTDLVIDAGNGDVALFKAPTVASDPSAGVLAALRLASDARGISLASLLEQTDTFIHGTTHAINAIITGNTARTALLVNRGHADILTFREGGREDPFNNSFAYPKPYIPRALTFEVTGRILSSGAIQTELDEPGIVAVLEELRLKEVEAIAVALLWSPINPAHEKRVGELIAAHLPGIPFSLSHEVNATLREFRRASAVSIDASLKPLMADYLNGLQKRLEDEGFAGNLMVLTSAGGMEPASGVAASPISAINSGPSMAPVAGRHYAELESSVSTVIVADTGGTTYDISLVRDGNIPMTRDLWIGSPQQGNLVGYPSIDVKSVGAGGGSIATVDNAGMLRVGPESAGAIPGPACYQRGGQQPTVTDACVVLGYVDPDYFLGGAMKLDAEASRQVIKEHVAKPLGVSLEHAAWSIIDLTTENMVQAIQDLAVNQGIDPAQSILIGGGGAAGLNSLFIARRLGSELLIIPETGAAMSAAGAMISDIAREFSSSVFLETNAFDHETAQASIDDLLAQCEQFSERAGVAGEISFLAEARYAGQAWEIDSPIESRLDDGTSGLDAFVSSFHKSHEQIFSYRDEGSAIEILGLRARVTCRVRPDGNFRLAEEMSDYSQQSRDVYFEQSGWVATPAIQFSAVPTNDYVAGPAIIESSFTTVVIDPDARFMRSANGSLLIKAIS